jgi:hypothetical protein
MGLINVCLVLCKLGFTLINFRPKLREFLRFLLNRDFGWDYVCFL